jgi:hypothetical protein
MVAVQCSGDCLLGGSYGPLCLAIMATFPLLGPSLQVLVAMSALMWGESSTGLRLL